MLQDIPNAILSLIHQTTRQNSQKMAEPTLYQHDNSDTMSHRAANSKVQDDWEDWEDDEPVTAIDDGDDPLITSPSEGPSRPQTRTTRTTTQSRLSSVRQSAHRITRLKSRHRQKAQNAKAGIRLETDMTKFRRQQQQQQQHIAFQMKPGSEMIEPRRGKFVDAAALKALEGDPSTATVGSFNWLKKKPSQASKDKLPVPKPVRTPVDQDLSPNDRPIMIGFSLPEAASHAISPQTAVVRTPVEFPIILAPSSNQSQTHLTTTAPFPQQQQQQRSVWSPDTDDGQSMFRSSVASSSLCSPPGIEGGGQGDVPPVPALPSTLKGGRRRTTIIADDVDAGTPITLFEEDGSPVATRKSPIARLKAALSPASFGRRSQGWWDEVTSPFAPQTPFTPSPGAAEESPNRSQAGDWWKGVEEKPSTSAQPVPGPSPVPTLEVPRRRGTPEVAAARLSSRTIASSSRSVQPSNEPETREVEKEALGDEPRSPVEQPPPYSPPSRNPNVRYRAVFPPGHPLNQQYPPSPGPMSPGLARAMSSQGAINMTDVPLTPPPQGTAMNHGDVPLPDRPLGSFVTGDHFYDVSGRGARQKAERKRRRHEKEDAAARKVGGLWRGRCCCLPTNGCYGRSGREGRKRRRVCCGAFAGVIALIILVIVLAVTLTRQHGVTDAVQATQWLNLTDFPPMPTGVSTVVGPDNSEAVTACVQPSTLWSCSLPKEQAASVAPFQPTQPKFIFQIQFDNSSSRSWDVTGQPPPGARKTRRSTSRPSRAFRRKASQESFNPNFSPNPAAPSFQEMWFLGNTTDGIESDEKAGEPTPFYITFLQSVNETVGPNILSRQDIVHYNTSNFPVPELNLNGTGAPAKLFPHPVQQPLRLYDRGLPTEHYGFYNYYDKSIYVKSKSPLDKSTAGQGEVPTDLDGGSLETEANFLVMWAQTRFKIEIWTRNGNTTRLMDGAPEQDVDSTDRPGTFPYPLTVTMDNHGGDAQHKGTVWYPVDDRQRVATAGATNKNVIVYKLDFNGPVINPAARADLSLGGVDGGTSGCKCEYTNFITLN